MNSIQTLLTDHLNIWTAADTEKKSGRGRSSGNAASVYGIRKLRELILELAVRGKLVPQDLNDEPASDLLKKIAAEKSRLIAEGKIKKDKLLPPITKDEKPYELPHGWEWVRLGQVVEVLDGFRKPVTKQDREPGPYPYYGASGIVDYVSNFIFDEPLVLVGEDGAKWGRGDTTAFLISGKTWVNNHAHVIRPYRLALIDDFVAISLNAMDLGAFITGMTVPKLNQARLVSIVLPLPSVAEQHRIVAKVDELMALCDQLEQQQTHSIAAHQTLVEILLGILTRVASQQEFSAAWARISSHFGTLFTTEASIDQLKQTILQLAVMGKLVSQDTKAEPASVLLDRIVKEKARLIEEGVIRKETALPEISEAENPHKIPESWEWVRLTDLYYSISPSGKKLKTSEMVDEGQYPVVDQGQSYVAGYTNDPELLIEIPGPIVIFGDHTTEIKYIDFNFVAGADGTKILRPYQMDEKYFYMYLKSYKLENRGYARHFKVLNANLMALPPLAEQHRIVAKVDELMALCDTLKARLTDAQAIQLHLADAIVEQAVC